MTCCVAWSCCAKRRSLNRAQQGKRCRLRIRIAGAMYERYFRFASKPFAMNPDPGFLYPSSQHAAALTMLEYAMESQALFCLLTGEIGSGKTTIVRHFLRGLGGKITVGLISNTHDQFRSIHPWALSSFGIAPYDDSDIAQYEA